VVAVQQQTSERSCEASVFASQIVQSAACGRNLLQSCAVSERLVTFDVALGSAALAVAVEFVLDDARERPCLHVLSHRRTHIYIYK
jgi:hypothetical protein